MRYLNVKVLIPTGVKWIAQDADGVWNFYKKEPFTDDYNWTGQEILTGHGYSLSDGAGGDVWVDEYDNEKGIIAYNDKPNPKWKDELYQLT